MLFKSKSIRAIYSGIAFSVVAVTMAGCDETYDLNDLGGDITLFGNGISAPVEGEIEVSVSELLTNDVMGDYIKIDEKGRYMLNFSGSIEPVTLEIPSLQLDEIDPDLASAHLDFIASLKSNPTIAPLLDAVGYTGGVLPDIPGLVVPEDVVHALIADATEQYNIVVNNVPEQIVGIKSVVPTQGTVATLSLHAEGFPTDIDSIRFEFLLTPPAQMKVKPVEKDIWEDKEHHYHIDHKLPCVNGKLDDVVHFYIEALEFDPMLTPDENGSILIESDLYYSGKVHITESFSLAGWTPQFDLSVGFKISSTEIEKVSGIVKAEVEPLEFSQELGSLPDFLTDPNTCLDLQSVLIELNVDNSLPLALNVDAAFQSTFYNGEKSPLVATQEPLTIAAGMENQKLIVTNDAQYADAFYIPSLDALVERIPQSVRFSATPYMEATEMTLLLNKTYELGLDYALSVPIEIGEDVNLRYEDEFDGVAQTLKDISALIDCARLSGTIESTLPLDLSLNLFAVDKNGTPMSEIRLSEVPVIKANATTPFALDLEIDADERTFEKLEKIMFSITGTSTREGELRPNQTLKIKNLTLHLPEGITAVEGF